MENVAELLTPTQSSSELVRYRMQEEAYRFFDENKGLVVMATVMGTALTLPRVLVKPTISKMIQAARADALDSMPLDFLNSTALSPVKSPMATASRRAQVYESAAQPDPRSFSQAEQRAKYTQTIHWNLLLPSRLSLRTAPDLHLPANLSALRRSHEVRVIGGE